MLPQSTSRPVYTIARTFRAFTRWGATALVLSGCTANIAGDSSAAGGAQAGGVPGGPGVAGAGASAIAGAGAVAQPGGEGRTYVHRLNAVELGNSITAVLGSEATLELPSIADPQVSGFDNNSEVLTFSEAMVESWLHAAERIVETVDLDTIAPCSAAGAACNAERFDALAPKLLKRPPTEAERQSYLALWDEIEARSGAATADRALLQRLLMSPEFLYHVEWGNEAGELSAHELASRLAFFAWEGPPDSALDDAAAQGTILTESGFLQQLDRALTDPRAAHVLQRLFAQWAEIDGLLDVTKDPAFYPEFDQLRGALSLEIEDFIADQAATGTMAALFTSREVRLQPELAEWYGAAPIDVAQRRYLLPENRGGLLTLASLLALHGKANKSAPIHRGKFVLEKVLCEPSRSPPPGANTASPDEVPPRTTREYYEGLTSTGSCAGCHSLINPVGFAFESFDGMGRFRTEENGYPVNSSGQLTAGDAVGPVAGAVELGQRLAASATVRECMARQAFRSRYRRSESNGDLSLIASAGSAVFSGSDRIMDLLRELALRPEFRHRHFYLEAEKRP